MDQPYRRLSIHGRSGNSPSSPLFSSRIATKGWWGAALILVSLLLSSCGGVLLVGAGVGAGAFSYIAGNVIREYEAEYEHGIEASTIIMKQYTFTKEERSEDGLKTIIEGTLDNDTPLTIEVKFIDQGTTRIGVRTGYIGNDNLELSEQLHTAISEELDQLALPPPQVISEIEISPEPVALKATVQKKKVGLTDDQSRRSRTLYDNLPPPPRSISASTADEPENMLSIDFGQNTQTPYRSENEQNDSEPLQARITELENEAEPSMTEPGSDQRDSGSDETGEKQGRQEPQTQLIPENKDKIFTYHPESERTIHSGSYRVLDQVIAYLDENPATRVDIRAYLDSSNDEDRDIALTQKRVFEIRNYLVLNGISEERISSRGLGENDFPEVNGADRKGSQKHPVEMLIR